MLDGWVWLWVGGSVDRLYRGGGVVVAAFFYGGSLC